MPQRLMDYAAVFLIALPLAVFGAPTQVNKRHAQRRPKDVLTKDLRSTRHHPPVKLCTSPTVPPVMARMARETDRGVRHEDRTFRFDRTRGEERRYLP